MKRITFFVLAILAINFSGLAQNRWNVYAGGSISHLCEERIIDTDKTYGWGGGAFVGGGYEINFNSNWSLTPRLELTYTDNGATRSSELLSFYSNHALWQSTWCVNIPILASFRFPVSDFVKFRIGAGPYIQEAIAGRRYQNGSDKKVSMHGNIANRFNVGAMGEFAVETGYHLSYIIRGNYPFLKEGWISNTLTLSVGIGYSF